MREQGSYCKTTKFVRIWICRCLFVLDHFELGLCIFNLCTGMFHVPLILRIFNRETVDLGLNLACQVGLFCDMRNQQFDPRNSGSYLGCILGIALRK